MKTHIRDWIIRCVAVLVHAFLLVSAFAPHMHMESAWVGVVPLILLARFTRGLKRSFLWGLAAGALFWLFNLGWMLRLAVTGGSWLAGGAAWLALSLYCSLYTGLFVMLASFLFKVWIVQPADSEEEQTAMGGLRAQVSLLVCLPLIWVGLEYIRSTLLSGFPWNTLAISQFRNLGMLQVAGWGGVYAVSGTVLLANTALAFMILRFVDMFARRRGPRFNLPLMLGVGGAVAIWLAGIYSGKDWRKVIRGNHEQLQVAAVQPAIPQVEKWDDDHDEMIISRLTLNTELGLALNPDLVIWPETACPFFVEGAAKVASGIALVMSSQGTPLLAGGMEYELGVGKTNFYNSAMLYDGEGMLVDSYRKMHLVPFGEYIPMEGMFPSLSRMAPLGFSCTPGDEMTVFELPGKKMPFSVLICFEDAFASLSRRAVRNGARFLVNQTNDAWFDGSSGSLQHMAHAVFRCAENRVPMVRCANTGVTCFIDSLGCIDETTRQHIDGKEELDDAGMRIERLVVPGDPGRTFYTRYGDMVLGIPCAVAVLLVFALAVAAARRENRANLSEVIE